MIVYIAGPMTGLKGFNVNSFNLAELALKCLGHEVRNPACLGAGWANYEHYIEVDMVMLSQCDAIVFLPGSDKSPGALREKKRAEELGIQQRTDMLFEVWGALQVAYVVNKGIA